MKTCFKEWLLKRESGSMDATSAYSTYSPTNTSSQNSFQINTPKANVPWQMNSFKNWYDSNRGSWNDVAQAAQTDPQVKSFMANLARQLMTGPYQTGPETDEDGNFDAEAPTKMGTLADQLENMVKRVNPQHGRSRGHHTLPSSGVNVSQRRTPPTTQRPSKGPSVNSQAWSQLQDIQSGQEQTQLMDVVRTLMLRIDDIERRLASQSVTTAA